MNKPSSTQVRIVLQGKEEPFLDYETRLNEILAKEFKNRKVIVMPTASSNGRMCSIINILERAV
jgi:hypothetical protein